MQFGFLNCWTIYYFHIGYICFWLLCFLSPFVHPSTLPPSLFVNFACCSFNHFCTVSFCFTFLGSSVPSSTLVSLIIFQCIYLFSILTLTHFPQSGLPALLRFPMAVHDGGPIFLKPCSFIHNPPPPVKLGQTHRSPWPESDSQGTNTQVNHTAVPDNFESNSPCMFQVCRLNTLILETPAWVAYGCPTSTSAATRDAN